MARKPKIDEQVSYNGMFFLLAGAFATVTAWAVYDETITRREYKPYQETFFKIEQQITRDRVAQLQAALTKDADYQKAKVDLAALQTELRGTKRSAYEKAKSDFESQKFVEFDARQRFTFTKSELDETYYYYTQAKHEYAQDPEAKDKFETLETKYHNLLERLGKDTKAMEAEQKILKDRQGAVDVFTKKIDELKAVIDVKEATLHDAERNYAAAKGKFGGIFGSKTEIQQYNLVNIERVDRCESCHVGSSRGGFESLAPEYRMFRSHPNRRTLFRAHPPENFGCTVCHDGQGRATQKFYAHAPSPEEDAHAYHTHYWETPLLKTPRVPTFYGVGPEPTKPGEELVYTEAKCRSCHKNEYDLRSQVNCESDAECSDAARTSGLKLSCKEAKAAGPAAALVPDAAFSDAPGSLYPASMSMAAKDLAAGKKPADVVKYCVATAGPTTGEAAVVDMAPTLSKGLKVIEEVGCFGCHPIEGYEGRLKPAPDLRRAFAKFSDVSDPGNTQRLQAWMVNWIMDPKAFRPNTRMPRFWPELLNPKEYPYEKTFDWKKYRTEQERDASAMAAFILASSRDEDAARPGYEQYKLDPLPAGGDAERGKQLVLGDDNDKDGKTPGGLRGLGCLGCHTYAGKQPPARNRGSHYDNGPDLANVGDKTTEQWLFNWIRDPKRYAPQTRMPSLRLSVAEAADIAKFLAGNKTGKVYALPNNPETGQPYDLNDKALIERGDAQLKYYGCYGCHSVQKYLTESGIGVELSEFGQKTTDRLDYGDFNTEHDKQTWDAWTYHKLRHPRVYSYEQNTPEKAVFTRMPQFDLQDDEIKAIMVVLKGMRGGDKADEVLGRKQTQKQMAINEGRALVRTYNCFGCHDIDGKRGDLRSLFGGPQKIYGPPTLAYEGMRTQPNWLFDFLKAPFKLRPKPHVRMPTFGFTDKETSALVEYFSSLDDAQYPFQDMSQVTLDHGMGHDAGVRNTQLSKAIFEGAQCQKCHVQGAAETAPEGAVAPDLGMARARLRPEWTKQWITKPQAFDPESPMPPFWANTNVLREQVKGGHVPDDKAGDTANDPYEQIALVRDYLFNYSKPGFGASDNTAAAKPAEAPKPANPTGATPAGAPGGKPAPGAKPAPGGPGATPAAKPKKPAATQPAGGP